MITDGRDHSSVPMFFCSDIRSESIIGESFLEKLGQSVNLFEENLGADEGD